MGMAKTPDAERARRYRERRKAAREALEAAADPKLTAQVEQAQRKASGQEGWLSADDVQDAFTAGRMLRIAEEVAMGICDAEEELRGWLAGGPPMAHLVYAAIAQSRLAASMPGWLLAEDSPALAL